MIAAIAEKTFSDRCDRMETTLQRRNDQSDRCNNDRWDRLQFNFSDRNDQLAVVVIIWKPLSSDHNDPYDTKYTRMHCVLYSFQDGVKQRGRP